MDSSKFIELHVFGNNIQIVNSYIVNSKTYMREYLEECKVSYPKNNAVFTNRSIDSMIEE